MARILPPEPHPDHLRNEAKALLKAHDAGDAATCKTFRLVHRFKDSADEQVLKSEISLSEAQFALAMDYGFESWEALIHEVERHRSVPDDKQPRPGAFLIKNPPASKPDTNTPVHGVVMSLTHSGCRYDHTTAMGDSGIAFILQADALHTAWGRPVKQLDIGWWPLDSWGLMLRLDFVGQGAGRRFTVLNCDEEEWKRDAAAHYRKHFEQAIVDALHKNLPPVVFDDFGKIVLGYDDGAPPLFVRCPFTVNQALERMKEYPWLVIVPGDPTTPMPRDQADVEALRYAVALGRDEISENFRKCPYRISFTRGGEGKTSGRKSFALWAQCLRDPDGWGANFYHANVIGNLQTHRKAAVLYLREMAERRGGAAAEPLRSAAEKYDQIVRLVRIADVSKDGMAAQEGRERLAKLIDEMARIEAQATSDLEKAIMALSKT